MTDASGDQILKGLKETRQFFEQVSLLVETAEDMLGESGWEAIGNNKCADITSHLHRPKKWMPSEVYRFFVAGEESDSKPGVLVFVGVLMDTEERWGGFNEPWVTCGLFAYDAEKFDVTKFNYWDWVRSHLDDKHEADGVFNDHRSSAEEEDDWEGLIYQANMALPLVSITSPEILKSRIVEPLLTRVADLGDVV